MQKSSCVGYLLAVWYEEYIWREKQGCRWNGTGMLKDQSVDASEDDGAQIWFWDLIPVGHLMEIH